MIKIIAVAGPTASGKTALALELAERFNGEIISCDSMQIYRGMDIGTAKPNAEELSRIPHHLIDIADPCENFSCAEYKILAESAAADITSRGKLPIFCGGTGLYLDAVLTGNRFPDCAADPDYREMLYKQDNFELFELLRRTDPAAADAIHMNNKKRMIRALEIYKTTGITKTEWDARSRLEPPVYDAAVLVPDYEDRELLYQRIEHRVDEMMERGLLEEVCRLKLPRDSTAAQAIGYKELNAYLDNVVTLDQAVNEIKVSTRNYAKRQMTWFRRRSYVTLLNIKKENTFKDIVNNALKLLTI
ncbi:MAG: tRNA (adenosine(37)-N6)-dimethylallyltransferase MiaA [Eubacteriales bacterium]